jgi:hypothetical protein
VRRVGAQTVAMTTCDPAGSPGKEKDRPVDVLRRWEAAGAQWRVITRSADRIDVALLTCDAGEEVGRFASDDPEVLEYVGDRPGSDT